MSRNSIEKTRVETLITKVNCRRTSIRIYRLKSNKRNLHQAPIQTKPRRLMSETAKSQDNFCTHAKQAEHVHMQSEDAETQCTSTPRVLQLVPNLKNPHEFFFENPSTKWFTDWFTLANLNWGDSFASLNQALKTSLRALNFLEREPHLGTAF
jgi:hypothetical protein